MISIYSGQNSPPHGHLNDFDIPVSEYTQLDSIPTIVLHLSHFHGPL
jgi:hypothetical protein